MTYDLRAEAQRLIEELHEPDPGVIADKLRGEIPSSAYDEVLAVTLRSYVREQIRARRRSPAKVLEPTTSLMQASPKWRMVRDLLDDSYSVDGEWKRLGDFTPDDCEWVASDYFDRAARNEVWGKKFQRLRSELRKRRKGHVADLPRELVEEVMAE